MNTYNIVLMIVAYFTANFIFAPSLPLVAEGMGLSNSLIKATMSYFQFGALFSCIIAAFFADYFGKKNYLLIGLISAVLGSILSMFATNIETLLLGRMLQGFGAASGFMIGFALAVDLFTPQGTVRIIAINGVVTAIVLASSPYLGGYIAEAYSWRGTFLLPTVMFLTALALSILYLPPESNKRNSHVSIWQSLREVRTILTSFRFLAYASQNGILITSTSFNATYVPFYFHQYFNMTTDQIGLLIGLNFAAFGLSSIMSVHIYKLFGTDGGIRFSLFCCLAGGLLILSTSFMAPHSLLLIVLSILIFSFGFGSLYAGSIGMCMRVFPDMSTKSSAIRTIMLTAGSFLGAFIAQNVNNDNLTNLALAYMIAALFGLFMFSLRDRDQV